MFKMLAIGLLVSLLVPPAVALEATPAGVSVSAPSLMDEQESLETEKLRLETEQLRNQLRRSGEERLGARIALMQSTLSILSILVGAWWVYSKFVRAQEKYPNIEFTADIHPIGKQKDKWVVELIANIANRGKAQHQMEGLYFDLNALMSDDDVVAKERWGGQVDFPHRLAGGSFLPRSMTYFFVDPATEAKYSYIASVPDDASFLILHCWFDYVGRGRTKHTAEKTIRVSLTLTPKTCTGDIG